ncbi:uncharacterized protein LOC113289351 [Papaver somniferum]|uniref:uncharacterized protein LOC113289351 n=1 Tax=Papaver somniferum TaxID=3469 RepID=UPI000E6F98F5|nr:uncharacterized protein LOC113289351 [Papaver somniferum]
MFNLERGYHYLPRFLRFFLQQFLFPSSAYSLIPDFCCYIKKRHIIYLSYLSPARDAYILRNEGTKIRVFLKFLKPWTSYNGLMVLGDIRCDKKSLQLHAGA